MIYHHDFAHQVNAATGTGDFQQLHQFAMKTIKLQQLPSSVKLNTNLQIAVTTLKYTGTGAEMKNLLEYRGNS